MTSIDVQRLLQPISEDQPAGPDLEGSADFQALVIAATGRSSTEINGHVTEAEEPNWIDVRDRAEALLCQSKDIQIAVLLTEALIRTDDLAGLRSGLELLHGFLETYWDTVWPELDLEDGDDAALLRLNRLKNLGDRGRVVRPVRQIKLPGTRMLGRFSLRDYEEINRAQESGEDGASERLSSFEGALLEADLGELREAADAARECRARLEPLETLVNEKSGVTVDLGLAPLAEAVGDIDGLLREFLTRRGVADAPAGELPNGATAGDANGSAATAATPPPPQQGYAGKISSRADVIKALDQACQYFEEFEPSSPVPLLLRRAKRLIAKDFISILRDMAPRGVEEAEVITGAAETESD